MPAPRFYRGSPFSSPCSKASDRSFVTRSSDWSFESTRAHGSPWSNTGSASVAVSSSPRGKGEDDSRASREDWCRIIKSPTVEDEKPDVTKETKVIRKVDDRKVEGMCAEGPFVA